MTLESLDSSIIIVVIVDIVPERASTFLTTTGFIVLSECLLRLLDCNFCKRLQLIIRELGDEQIVQVGKVHHVEN